MDRLTEEEQRTHCQICGKVYKHLGSHVAKGHKMTAREYKEEFGLDYKFSLISKEVREKKQAAFEKDREKYLKNLVHDNSKYQFKKGHRHRTRWSEQTKRRIAKYANDHDGECPVCNMYFDHVGSHLYNKHGLKVAKEVSEE